MVYTLDERDGLETTDRSLSGITVPITDKLRVRG
jgi:hypothetical protein